MMIPVSCLNEAMNCVTSKKSDIVVGMAATKFVGSDRYACVVTDVISDKKIMVCNMTDEDYVSLDENEKCQYLETSRMGKYITLSKDGKHIEPIGVVYTLRKNGRWLPAGSGLWATCSIHLGHADEYRDPSF